MGLQKELVPHQMNQQECEAFFNKHKPEVVITGTSWGSNSEQMIRNHCHEKNIPHFTAVDYWANYLERWKGSTYPLHQAKEKIFVIDQNMKSEMVKIGFSEKSLLISGHPALEKLEHKTPIATKSGHETWLFLAEPSSRVNFMWILTVFDHLQKSQGEIVTLDYKLHPKEQDPQNWESVFEELKKRGISTQEYKGDLHSSFDKYDGIMGYQTMGLFEAAFSGLRTVSIPDKPLSPGVQQAMQDSGIYIHTEFKEDSLMVAHKRTLSFLGAAEKIVTEVKQSCS